MLQSSSPLPCLHQHLVSSSQCCRTWLQSLMQHPTGKQLAPAQHTPAGSRPVSASWHLPSGIHPWVGEFTHPPRQATSQPASQPTTHLEQPQVHETHQQRVSLAGLQVLGQAAQLLQAGRQAGRRAEWRGEPRELTERPLHRQLQGQHQQGWQRLVAAGRRGGCLPAGRPQGPATPGCLASQASAACRGQQDGVQLARQSKDLTAKMPGCEAQMQRQLPNLLAS